ncbi:MAG: protein-methionine-sulfoxide reductase heme-binding subunit MsrQ [Myxococcota bacterium]
MAATVPVARRRPLRPLAWLQPAIVVGSLAPFAVILARGLTGGLGANPIATAMNQLGLLALIFLVASLACSPLRVLFRWRWPIKIRRTLGLMGFFAACVHFGVWLVLDQGLALQAIAEDILGRPFILVGFLALLLLLPLAQTSSQKAMRRLGYPAWKRLHRLAYVAAGLGVVHYFLRVKADVSEPLVYGVVLLVLFAVRAYDFRRQRSRRRAAALRG